MDILRIKNEKMRIWSNGKISLCQGEDAGSIPAIRPKFILYDKGFGIVGRDSVVVLSSPPQKKGGVIN